MPKTLYDIMDASDDCVIEFERACKELCESKYILAEHKISQLLQVIAKSKNLYALMGACLQGFDFGAELALAKTDRGLMIPQPRKAAIAFVFCLLLSVDTNQTDFKKFLHAFYPSTDINYEYAEFAKKIVMPFCENVKKAYFAEAEEPVYAPAPSPTASESLSSPTVQPAADPTVSAPGISDSFVSAQVSVPSGSLDALAIRSLSDIACEIIGIVARDSTISARSREELMLVAEGFDQAVKIGVEKAIRTMYIGLKYTIECSPLARQLEVQYGDLERLIAEYDLD